MSLDDASFVVVDTETTGTKAGRDRLLEIGAVRLEEGTVTDRFSALVNPGRTIPARITKITGITTGMVVNRPPAEEVLPEFLDFLGEDVFVAHNVPFDLRFLNAALKRTGHPELSNDTLCTLRLARRLLTGLRSKGLSALTKFYGIRISARHRAGGDAEATAQVLQRLLRHVEFEHEISSLKELLTFQYRSYSNGRRQPKHVRHIRKETLPDLPDRPGVYFMKDGKGGIIYIGKAKCLKNRVSSYFRGTGALPSRTQKLLRSVRDVEWEVMDSELQALLEESRLIKEHKPRYNRAQRRYGRRPFIKLDLKHEAPVAEYAGTIVDDGAEYYGPLAGRKQADLVLEVIDRVFKLRSCDEARFNRGERCLYADVDLCTAPCEDSSSDAYQEEVDRVRAFLQGNDHAVVGALEDKMKRAAERLDFEQASEFRDMMQRLDRMLKRQKVVAAPVLKHNAVLMEPGASPSTVNVLCLRFGRLERVLVLPTALTEEGRERLDRCIRATFDPGLERPERYKRAEVDALRLLAQWLHANRDSLVEVRWSPNRDIDSFVREVEKHVSGGLHDAHTLAAA